MVTEKVFPYVLNRAAFIDTITMSVWGMEKLVRGQLLDEKPVPILSRKSKSTYAWRVTGKAPLTGNPVRILYGKNSRFPRVPPCRVTMWSEEAVLTGAQVNETMRLIFPAAQGIQPTQVELTFDLQGASVAKLHRQMIHGARQWSEMQDSLGRKTVYIGSPASPWQVKLYDKTAGVVRLELTLRRDLLRKRRIEEPDKVVTLRSLKLQRMFSLRRFSRSRVAAATQGWNDQYWQDVACNWERNGSPLQPLCRMLVARGDKTGRLLPFARLQQTLEKMQRNLIW
jgi:hypothetical protein